MNVMLLRQLQIYYVGVLPRRMVRIISVSDWMNWFHHKVAIAVFIL